MADSGEPTSNWAPLFDTGTHQVATVEPPGGSSGPIPIFAPPEQVPGVHAFLKRWVLGLVLAAVWLAAGVAGMALYEWWFASLDKTGPVFVVLVYLVVCSVVGMLLAMVPGKPLVTALSIALMSAPLAATAGAGLLYGSYVYGWFGQ